MLRRCLEELRCLLYELVRLLEGLKYHLEGLRHRLKEQDRVLQTLSSPLRLSLELRWVERQGETPDDNDRDRDLCFQVVSK